MCKNKSREDIETQRLQKKTKKTLPFLSGFVTLREIIFYIGSVLCKLGTFALFQERTKINI